MQLYLSNKSFNSLAVYVAVPFLEDAGEARRADESD